MIHALTMPSWGMEDSPGTVVKWIANEGDAIERGREIVEIETTKLTNVIESPFAGTLSKIAVQKGETAPSGALLAAVVDGEATVAEVDAFVEAHKHIARAPEDAGPTERRLETTFGSVHLVTQAGGPAVPVVLLHGFGADLTSWAFVFRLLSRRRTVHMLDLPGHGGSFKTLGASALDTLVGAVVEAVNTLEGPFHLVGHSLGALVAVTVADRAPASVRSVSLIAPAGLGGSINTQFLEMFADADNRKKARSAIELLVTDPSAVTLAMVNDVIRARRIEGAKEALHALRTELTTDAPSPRTDVRANIGRLNCPVQLVLAAEDRIITPAEPPANLTATTILSGAGHLLHIERSNEVGRLLESFMEQADD